jgi:putative nucleotidyltransferase with HDIG domain
VGSYYHDIGKILRPYFFVENQTDGENVHEKLDPVTSAQIIISHVADGLVLARRYGLPDKIQAFIPEHHGTMLAAYFYRMAINSSEDRSNVDESDFRYAGPKPQSKETAIVMLADSTEARVRAERPPTPEDMDRLTRETINDRLGDGQLDECDLTLRDLEVIREAFLAVLQGIFHPRIQYPEATSQERDRRSAQRMTRT